MVERASDIHIEQSIAIGSERVGVDYLHIDAAENAQSRQVELRAVHVAHTEWTTMARTNARRYQVVFNRYRKAFIKSATAKFERVGAE